MMNGVVVSIQLLCPSNYWVHLTIALIELLSTSHYCADRTVEYISLLRR